MDDQRLEGGPGRRPGDAGTTRRGYLRAAAGAGGLGVTSAVAGCLGLGSPGGPNTYLAAPDRGFDASELPYPTHGDPLPEVTVSAPLHGERVSTTQFDRDRLLTFFYSHCQSVCPRLVSTLRNVQTRAAEEGHGERVAFLATTFDPERDTEERLRSYADRMNVDRDAGNWYFLRPEPGERTKEVVTDTFGVAFQKQTIDDGSGEDGHDHGGKSAGDGGTPTDGRVGAEGAYGFVHAPMILLANADGYVERAYRETQPVWQDVYDDFATLRGREGR